MRVKFSRKFSKTYDKAPSKIRDAFDKRLELYLKNPFNPQLNNHPLGGQYQGYRSINVTGDWRAIFSINERDRTIVFEMIGTHSQLYK